jgi:alpha-beta hydrolase superfamily lysophospholipase
VKERSLAFGPEAGMIGTLCLPESPAGGGARVGMLLFNAGVVHRTGPHRINVRLARRLAGRGIPSLRFDLSGQGDSARPAGGLGFEQQAVADLRAAMDLLAAETGVTKFALFGFCSGGCHSYAAAQADERVAGIVLYDTYIFRSLRSRANRYLVLVRSKGFLRALARLLQLVGAEVARHLRLASAREAPPESSYQLGGLSTPTPAQFAATLRRLQERGARVALVHSGGFDDYNYAAQFHDRFRSFGLGPNVTCDYFPDLGHSTTIIRTQGKLLDRLVEWTTALDASLRRGAAPEPARH